MINMSVGRNLYYRYQALSSFIILKYVYLTIYRFNSFVDVIATDDDS